MGYGHTIYAGKHSLDGTVLKCDGHARFGNFEAILGQFL
jgi:hypothetical protein